MCLAAKIAITILVRNGSDGQAPARVIPNQFSVALPVKCNRSNSEPIGLQRPFGGRRWDKDSAGTDCSHSLTRYGARDRIL